jgi:uncharacterized membrane protein
MRVCKKVLIIIFSLILNFIKYFTKAYTTAEYSKYKDVTNAHLYSSTRIPNKTKCFSISQSYPMGPAL